MDVLRTIMDEIECVVSKVEKEEIDRVAVSYTHLTLPTNSLV